MRFLIRGPIWSTPARRFCKRPYVLRLHPMKQSKRTFERAVSDFLDDEVALLLFALLFPRALDGQQVAGDNYFHVLGVDAEQIGAHHHFVAFYVRLDSRLKQGRLVLAAFAMPQETVEHFVKIPAKVLHFTK